jgi:antitoxin component of MazEF toxin-antitoxin module
METIKTKARKWGDSIAVIIPKFIVESQGISPQDDIMVSVQKEDNLEEIFGKFKTKKTAQQLKDESREGWE